MSDTVQRIAIARHYEALSARAWPAAYEKYDGLYIQRVTENHPSQRLNCVMPLDPADHDQFEQRLKRLCYDKNGQFQYSLRQTPLCPVEIIDFMQHNNWQKGEEVALMRLDLADFSQTKEKHCIEIEEIAAKDYVTLSAKLYQSEQKPQQAFLEIIARMKAKPIFIRFSYDNRIIGNILCAYDYGEIGLLDFAIDKNFRKQGLGLSVLQSLIARCCKNAEEQKTTVKAFWLQVETKNKNAIKLYQKIGFKTLYSLHHWKQV